MRSNRLTLIMSIMVMLLVSVSVWAQTTVTIGTGSSSSSTRGPFQRADTNSSTVFSRWIMVYTASELAAAGVTNGASITELQWELASSNIIVGSGDATLKIYVKNSSATAASSDTWANHITGSTMVLDEAYNTTNNFPGANGWMPFSFTTPFTYTGGALEIAVDWDCSQVTTPAFSGNGAIKFRWQSTSPDFLVVKKTSSSSPSTSITDLKTERANIQIVFNAIPCDPPSNLIAANIGQTSADLSWDASANASNYNWKVVAAGAGSGATAVASGSTSGTTAVANGLMATTGYDLYVSTDCSSLSASSNYAGPYSFSTAAPATATIQIGSGSSSSSTRGPLQRSDTNSTTVFSRWIQVYTASELATAGLTSGSVLTSVNWELASSNVIIGSGDANLKVYIKNSSATAATSDTWANHISGSSLVYNEDFNVNNNFPGANGWMPFDFSTPFTYTGGAIEIAVDWDCSQISTPSFSGDGALKWRWESTAPNNLVVKKTSSSSPSTTISDLKNERANIQLVYAVAFVCDAPSGLGSSSVGSTSADLYWSSSANASSYNWKVVTGGSGSAATGIDSGNTNDTSATASGLMAGMMYDLYVESDCGSGTSSWGGPYSFSTCVGLDSIIVVDANQGVYRAYFPNLSPGANSYQLAFKAVNDTVWKTKSFNNPNLGTIKFNITPNFNTTMEVRVGENFGGAMNWGCISQLFIPCKNMSIQMAEQTGPRCAGDTALVRVGYAGGQGVKSILWSNGATNKRTYADQGETLYVTVTDASGCSLSDTITASLLNTATAPTNMAATRSGSIVTASWSPSNLGSGQSLIGYRVNYRLRGTTTWSQTVLGVDTFQTIDMTTEPGGNYEFAAVARYNDNGSNTTSNRSCFAARGWPGISSKRQSVDLNSSVNVYPNPVNDVLIVELDQESTIRILDINGKSLVELNGTQGSTSINLSDLSAGVYLLEITTAEDSLVERVIKK